MRPRRAPEPLTVLKKVELAAWLRVSPRTIERLKIPSLPLDAGGRRYLVADVLKWLEVRKERAA